MRELSNQLLTQLYKQESEDPFLMLLTLTHDDFAPIYLVNNTEPIVSRGKSFIPFPVKITLPADDGETQREVAIEFDNASAALIAALRSVITPIEVTIEMILASAPDRVEIEIGELKIKNITYNKTSIQGRLFMDDFLNTEMTSEKYSPTNFPGLFQ